MKICIYVLFLRKKTALDKGHFTLASDISPHQSALDKYTISNAIVLSVKLGVWEHLLEKYVSSIQSVVEVSFK